MPDWQTSEQHSGALAMKIELYIYHMLGPSLSSAYSQFKGLQLDLSHERNILGVMLKIENLIICGQGAWTSSRHV